jgi:hypothetical protein
VNDTTRELGGALGVAVVGSVMASLYTGGIPVAGAAREEFVGAMSTASSIVAAVAVVGAVIAWRHLPQRAAPATRAGAVTELS